jgi:SAM-dependent methyltransferase
MNLNDILQRNMDLQPWVEGERIPWDDPAFSQRILGEHLTQEHDAASRRKVKIKKQVDWIHKQVLDGKPTNILDLGCGPGLYAAPFIKLGHTYAGIDFSPACIEYARKNAPQGCNYQLSDVRSAEYGNGYGLILFIFGALNIVPTQDAHSILEKAYKALNPGGTLLLEVSTLDAVDQIGNQPSMWYSAEASLFSDKPHLCLMENFWDEEQAIATERFYIVDAKTGEVTRHAASTQAYDEEQIESLLRKTGYGEVTFFPSLTGKPSEGVDDFLAVIATRPA